MAHNLARKGLMLALVGTTLEYFDYALYGFCASYIAQSFYPQFSLYTGIQNAFIILMLAGIAKPLGAILWGWIGDTYGRAIVLRYCIGLIGFPTLILGVLPGYYWIGDIAPVLLLILRCSQSLLIGGQLDNVSIYLSEHFNKKYPYTALSVAAMAAFIGISLAAFAESIVANSSSPNYFWRYPFIIAGITSLICASFRHNFIETKQFSSIKNMSYETEDTSIFFEKNLCRIINSMILLGSLSACYQFYFIFLPQYLTTVNSSQIYEIGNIKSLALTFYCLMCPISGLLADKYGGKFIVNIGGVTLLVMAIINTLYLYSESGLNSYIMLLTGMVMPLSLGPVYLLVIQSFDIKDRCRGLGISHALASCLISTPMPAICWFISNKSGQIMLPCCYWVLLLIVAIIFLNAGGVRYVQQDPY